ncbi:MAG: M1 family metallopeptidase [Anaerolineae bacterium]|nr:M1 family metallopeptidase [Anaerolineae bacterium]
MEKKPILPVNIARSSMRMSINVTNERQFSFLEIESWVGCGKSLPTVFVLPIILGLLLSSCLILPERVPTAPSPSLEVVLHPSVVFVPADAEKVASPTLLPSPTPVVTVTPRDELLPVIVTSPASEILSLPYSQYHLTANLDYLQHALTVSEVITYLNRSSEILQELRLVVEANRQPEVFFLKGLKWIDGQAIADYTLDGATLIIPMLAPLLPDDTITLWIEFQLNLPAQSGPLGYTSRQTNVSDWYPYIPSYRSGEGWLAHNASAVGEHAVYDVADYQVDIRLLGDASGLVVAAGTLIATQNNVQRYQLNTARNFSWSVSAEYQVMTRSVGAVEVISYIFPEHLTAGVAALDATSNALTVYSALFGKYAHASLGIIEADFVDGMEYDGLYFLGQEYFAAYDGTPRGYLTALAVHETAHQWWCGLIGNDQAIEPWLDESLATYSELLFYEQLYPDLVNWWWDFRVNRFSPAGWVNSTVYDHSGFRPYVNAVYLRGALFMQELRELIGDEVFFAFLQDYATDNIYKQTTARDFFELLAQHSSVDLDELRSRFFK